MWLKCVQQFRKGLKIILICLSATIVCIWVIYWRHSECKTWSEIKLGQRQLKIQRELPSRPIAAEIENFLIFLRNICIHHRWKAKLEAKQLYLLFILMEGSCMRQRIKQVGCSSKLGEDLAEHVLTQVCLARYTYETFWIHYHQSQKGIDCMDWKYMTHGKLNK